jgi:hypothetical protein
VIIVSILPLSQSVNGGNYYESASLEVETGHSRNGEQTSAQSSAMNETIASSSPLNLSNNTGVSVYPQVSSSVSGKVVYVAWQDNHHSDSIDSTNRNYDIFFRKSIDYGETFGNTINLSNNSGLSERPQMVTTGNNVYVVWADNTTRDGSSEIFFTKSTDNGTSFSDAINLSNTSDGDSHQPEIAVTSYDVNVVWRQHDKGGGKGDIILFRSSTDGGATFGNVNEISNNNSSLYHAYTYPKVSASGKYIYVIWNGQKDNNISGSNNNNNASDLFFSSSTDGGLHFASPARKLFSGAELEDSQITSYESNVYIVWQSINHSNESSSIDIFFITSSDNGTDFDDLPIVFQDQGISKNGAVAALDDNIFVIWEGFASGRGEIYYKVSDNKGRTFGSTVNLSNNPQHSLCPHAVIATNNVYAVWEDSKMSSDPYSDNSSDILFVRIPLPEN